MPQAYLQKRILSLIVGGGVLLTLPTTALAQQKSPVVVAQKPSGNTDPQAATKKAVEDLFKSIDYANTYQQTLSRLIEVQIQQQPRLEPYREIMTSFLNKYMSWSVIKDEIIALYSDTFTTAEIKELTAFYSTPLGKKALKTMPELTAKGAALGQRRVMAHEQELLDLIREAEKANENQDKDE
jgi:uncharacterized protein